MQYLHSFPTRRSSDLNSKSIMADNVYDAIVIGSGISGGWAAKELCEKGLKTIMLERGKDIVHIKDYPDRKSTRLNSSHPSISYAVFCLKKKKCIVLLH